jgi:enamine deaminase RidA (YjgF/YER057c/UK114 family)
MRFKVFRWLGEEFVSLSWEGNGEGTIADEMRELFGRFGDWLGRFGLTLDNTVRTRMFVRDIDTWHVAAAERAKCLTGRARSTSSSHVSPERLGTKPRFSIDLLAMHAPQTGEQKILREYEPQTVVLRRMTWGKLVFCSGVTDMTTTTLDEQYPIVIGRLTDTLRDAGVSWERVERASFFLHRDESIPELRERLARTVDLRRAEQDFTLVDTRQGKRLEIELTATLA